MLRAAHLTRRFGQRLAVDDLTFEIEQGEILALVGPNGAGKTTTLRMLAGLISPNAGTVHVGDDVVTPFARPSVRARIGLLTEAPGLWDGLTVQENLLTFARLQGLEQPATTVAAALTRFGLTDRATEYPPRLSTGLRQRVAIARCLLHDPQVVLLDEPTSGLDPESAREVRDTVVDLRARGRAVLLCSHNLHEVDELADRVVVLRTRVLVEGTLSALRARGSSATLRVDLDHEASGFVECVRGCGASDTRADGRTLVIALSEHSPRVPEIIRQLVEAGASIRSVVDDHRSLERAYLDILRGDSGR